MCLAMADQMSGQVRRTRDNINSLGGWGTPGTRGEQAPSNVTIYNQLPGGDIAKADTPGKDSLKVSNGGKK